MLTGIKDDLAGVVDTEFRAWVEEIAPLVATYAMQAAAGDATAADRLVVLRAIAKQKAARITMHADAAVSDKLSLVAVVLAKFALKLILPT